MLAFQAILEEISFSSSDFIAKPQPIHANLAISSKNSEEILSFDTNKTSGILNEKTSFLSSFCENTLKEFEELSFKDKTMRKSFFDPIEINVKEFDLFAKED